MGDSKSTTGAPLEYCWRNCDILLGGRKLINALELGFKRTQEVEKFFGNDGEVSGYGVGNISADGKLQVSGQEYAKVLDFAVAQGYDLLKMPAIPLIAELASPDLETITFVIPVKFKEESFSMKSGDKRIAFDLPFEVTGPVVKYKS